MFIEIKEGEGSKTAKAALGKTKQIEFLEIKKAMDELKTNQNPRGFSEPKTDLKTSFRTQHRAAERKSVSEQ